MKNKVSVKYSESLLFLIIGFISLCSPFVIKGQIPAGSGDLRSWEDDLKQNLTKLADVYEGELFLLSPGTIRTLYIFEKPSKVVVRKIVEIPAENRMLYNIATGRMEPVLSPASSKTDDFVGTYTQKGNKIRIVVSNIIIEATIVKDGLEGIEISNDGNRKNWAAIKISNNATANSTTSSGKTSGNQSSARNNSTENKYFARDDNPLIGTWKYQDGCKTEVDFFGKNSTTCKTVSTFTYSSDGHYQILVGGYLTFPTTFTGKWKYTAEDKSSGVLEHYENDKLTLKGNVKFLGKSQFQYTITFSRGGSNNTDNGGNSNNTGNVYVLNKQ